MSSELIEVFVGAPLEDPNEARVLGRLREDLAAADIRARIYANFVAGRRGKQRQIDLLIETEQRLVQAELKTVDLGSALSAKKNGPWKQAYPDGTFKVLGNYYEQASQATFAVNDYMEELARAGKIPRHSTKYVKDIDSVILIAPRIPDGSQIERRDHVTVIGYDQLVDRLTKAGPRPSWTGEHWNAFALELGLFQPDPETNPEERGRREVLDKARDYRTRLVAGLKVDLHDYVPVGGSVGGSHAADLRLPVLAALRSGGTVAVTGVSGSGKSHLATQVSVALAEGGMLPIFTRCRDFHGGNLPDLIRGAAARFTVEKVVEFIARSNLAGVPSVLILDGLNECEPEYRDLLLNKVAEFRLRHPASMLVTSTAPIPIPRPDATMSVELPLPSPDERAALFRSYGVEPSDDLLQFERPFEIAIVAEVRQELPPNAPRGALYDAYIRRSVDETHRTALRHLARFLHQEIRTSLTVAEAEQILRAFGTRAEVIDETLGALVLESSRNRVSFIHELIGEYLAAEALVLDRPDTADLAAAAVDPANAGLEEFMLACEPLSQRRHALLRTRTGARHLPKAAGGTYGQAVRALVAKDIRDAVETATFETLGARLVADEHVFPAGHRWEVPSDFDPLRGMLLATGWQRFKTNGEFATGFIELFDETDDILEREVGRLRTGGIANPVDTVIASSLGNNLNLNNRGLPVTPLLDAIPVFWDRVPIDAQTIDRIWQPGLRRTAWTRIMAALRLLEGGTGPALTAAPDLVTAAWSTGAAPIRLEALLIAKTLARNFDHTTRERMQGALDAITRPDNIWLSSALVEALAANGGIEPMRTKSDILNEVNLILWTPSDPANQLAAQRVFSAQHDPADVVGPYREALDSLPGDHRVALATIALSAERAPVLVGPEMLRLLADALPLSDTDSIKQIFARFAAEADFHHGMVQDNLAMHLHAVRGLAILGEPLPPPLISNGERQPAWEFLDRAYYAVHAAANEPPEGPLNVRMWTALYGDIANALAGISACEYEFSSADDHSRPHIVHPHFDAMRSRYQDEMRIVFELAVANPDGISGRAWWADTREVMMFSTSQLADIGDAESISVLRSALEGEYGALAAKSIRSIERRLSQH